MDWKDVGEFVSKSAPMLGTIIGGPLGGAAGGAISLILSAFGIGDADASDPEKLLTAIQGDPQAAIKLKEIELNNRVELAKLALQADQLAYADTSSARQREMEIVKATGQKDINLYVLAWTVIVGFFGLCGILMNITLPAGSNEVVFLLFGGLVSGFGQVLGYFFGSSKSSAEKTRILANGKR